MDNVDVNNKYMAIDIDHGWAHMDAIYVHIDPRRADMETFML